MKQCVYETQIQTFRTLNRMHSRERKISVFMLQSYVARPESKKRQGVKSV